MLATTMEWAENQLFQKNLIVETNIILNRRYLSPPLRQDGMISREEISEELLLQNDLASLIPYKQSQPQSAITSQIEAVLNWILSKRIMILQPAEVRAYLLCYPDMGDILPFICRTASERFKMHTQLSLEVYHDSEIEDKYLTLYIRQEHYDEHILDMIEDICVEYEEELADKSGWLLVTTDFHPPRVGNHGL
ncbi:hypothetical protein KJ693_01935 [bacterium]|nr:hypothetical protein [bacterium]MBU1614050.1 hypothetical protein [bacterium]